MNQATFAQAKASDAWGEFQANSIKRNLYETMHDSAPKGSDGGAPDAAKQEEAFKSKVAKYEQRQGDAKKQADGLEKDRDKFIAAAADSTSHGGNMGSIVSYFQISIALGSICLVAKKKWLWYVSLLLAALATAKMALVWMM